MTELVMTEEMYLSINGASRLGIGDSALHKNKGNNSDKVWSKIVDNQVKKDKELLLKREELRKEYAQKVANGQIRPPTRIEKLISIARGEECEARESARRILEKNNISY